MKTIKNFILNVLVNKYAFGSLVKGWKFFQGYRTQGSVFLGSLVMLAGFFGFIELDIAFQMATAIGGTAFASFMDKLNRHKDYITVLSGKMKAKGLNEMASDAASIAELDAATKEAVAAVDAAAKKNP